MKVRLGKYPNRLTSRIYTNYMTKKYGYVNWPNTESRFEQFLEKLEDTLQTLYLPINYFLDKRTQKIKVRIDPWDTWSMDHTLAPIILPMLKQLKETKHGAPYVAVEDVPRHLWPTKEQEQHYDRTGNVDDYWFDRWDWVLNEMIWAFEQLTLDNGWDEQYYKYEKDPNEDFGLKLVWEDPEGRKAHAERIQNGFCLFGKYYQSLWD